MLPISLTTRYKDNKGIYLSNSLCQTIVSQKVLLKKHHYIVKNYFANQFIQRQSLWKQKQNKNAPVGSTGKSIMLTKRNFL